MAPRPGTGFRIHNGALSNIEESGGSGDRQSVPFNLAAQPFGVDGTRLISPNDAARDSMLQRYKGGNSKYVTYVPQGDYGEMRWRPNAVLAAMYLDWKKGSIPAASWGMYYFEGTPEDWTGQPTLQEETDYSYALTRPQSERLYKQYVEDREVASPGEQPARPPKTPPNTVPPVQPPPVAPPTTATTATVDLSPVLARLDTLTKDLTSLRDNIESLTKKINKEAEQNDKQMRTLLTRSKELLERR